MIYISWNWVDPHLMPDLRSDFWWWSNEALFNLDVTCEISSLFHSFSLISAELACRSCVLFSAMFWWVAARFVWLTNFVADVNGWDCCTSIWFAVGDVVCCGTDWFNVGSWAGIGIGAFGVAKPGICACCWWCCKSKIDKVEKNSKEDKISVKLFFKENQQLFHLFDHFD